MKSAYKASRGAAEIAFTTSPSQTFRNRCPICKASAAEPMLKVSDTPLQRRDLHMSRCLHCGTGYFTEEHPVLGYDNEDFESDYWYNYVQNGAGITAMLEPLLAIDRSRSGKLLDVGCGFGFIPHIWSECGFGDSVGLEVSRYGREGRDKLGIRLIPKYYADATEIHGERFDYVYSSEVIEHVEDPAAFVREISQALADNGILVLTTPSVTILKEDSSAVEVLATLSPDFHFFVSSAAGLRDLLHDCGFEHVVVRDLGHRLFAWASHQTLPALKEGFGDWDLYIGYLERLAGNEDPHVAGGALYRSFKDCVNLGRFDDARRIYPRFAELAKQAYGIDFDHPDAAPATHRAPEDAFDYARFPAWTGSAFYHVGKFENLNGVSMDRLTKLFTAATTEMTREIEQGKQFAGEAAHFLPMARMEVARLQSAQHTDQHDTPPDQMPAYIQREVGSLTGRDVCLLAIYAPDGKVSAATGRYIECLHAAGFTTIACLAVNDIAAPVDMTNLNSANGIFVRKNAGMDFAMWAAVLRCHPDAWNAARLVFTNDSVLVLPNLFPAFAADLRAVETPVVGLTEGLEPQHHFQSYFFMLQGDALRDARVQKFWSGVRLIEDKWELIKTYEIKLLQMFQEEFQLPVAVLYSFNRLFPRGNEEALRRHNVSISCWEYLIHVGMPFVKAELIRANPFRMAIEHWRVLVAENGADVADIETHIGVPRPTLAKNPKKKRIKKRHRLLAALGFRRH